MRALAVEEVWSGLVAEARTRRPDDTISVPPSGRVSVRVPHPAVSAYQSCDRFGYRLTFEIDETTKLSGVVPMSVIREEPYRRR
jgi:hypothetical protein